MKRFFTTVPFQVRGELRAYRYQAVDNSLLQTDFDTCFPILTAANGYVQPGERFSVVAVIPDSAVGEANLTIMRRELDALCARKGCPAAELIPVRCAEDQRVTALAALFQTLIGHVQDDDELFSCMTFGTKPLSSVLTMALQYGYRVKRNVSIECVLYGEIRRYEKDPNTWNAYVYDMTALLQLDEIVRKLAERGVSDPKAVIDSLLSL